MRENKTHRTITRLRQYFAHRPMVALWMAIVFVGPWALKGCSLTQPVIHDDCTVSSVHDGDTLRAECQGKKLKVRLYCIDAPEMGQKPWGKESRDYLRSLLPQGTQVQLVVHDTDRYGRQVAEVMQGTANRNLAMVRSGNAAVYNRYCPESYSEYYRTEALARSKHSGIWGKPGLHQSPWKWRYRKR